MPKRVLSSLILLSLLFLSCAGGASDLSVVSKTLKRDVNQSTGGEIGDVPASGAIFWVVGQVKNSGAEDVANVTINFRLTDSRSRIVLSAVVPLVPAGKTVDFSTPVQGSRNELSLVAEDPEITVAR